MEDTPYSWAVAPPLLPAEPALGNLQADACVIGGGLTGLSAALHLARAGASVVLLEAGRIGRGASGRSGGQLIPGLRHGAVELVRRFGPDRSRALVDLTLEARTDLADIAVRHGCNLVQAGHLTAASHADDLGWMEAELRCSTDTLGLDHLEMVPADKVQAHVATDSYHGGLFDRLGGHADPLGLARALAAEARAAGVRICEQSPVLGIQSNGPPGVRTAEAAISARDVVLACDAGVGSVAIDGRRAAMRKRLMPVESFSVATEPLGADRAAALLPGNAAVSDTRFALDYYRRSADHRLLFSGGERYTLRPVASIETLVRARLAHVFPVLADIRIDFAWAGTVAVTTTRFPQVGRRNRLWFAHGYSGHGLLLAPAAGRAIALAIGGDSSAHDLLAGLPTANWPGGGFLRHPLYTAGMLWHARKDRK